MYGYQDFIQDEKKIEKDFQIYLIQFLKSLEVEIPYI